MYKPIHKQRRVEIFAQQIVLLYRIHATVLKEESGFDQSVKECEIQVEEAIVQNSSQSQGSEFVRVSKGYFFRTSCWPHNGEPRQNGNASSQGCLLTPWLSKRNLWLYHKRKCRNGALQTMWLSCEWSGNLLTDSPLELGTSGCLQPGVQPVCILEKANFPICPGGRHGRDPCSISLPQEERGRLIYHEAFSFSVVFLLGTACKKLVWVILQFN